MTQLTVDFESLMLTKVELLNPYPFTVKITPPIPPEVGLIDAIF